MRIGPDDVASWIAEGEGRRLEFKRGLPRPERTARVLSAFANTNGGILLVGVTDQGRVFGVPRPADVIARLRRIAKEGLDPPLRVELRAVELDGGAVVCCSVPLSRARPHAVLHEAAEPEVCIRVGSSNRTADGPTRRALSERPSKGGLDELERRVLAWVAERADRGARPDSDATVAAFARDHNVGKQRARRAFVRLERAGRLVGHGPGARRVFGIP